MDYKILISKIAADKDSVKLGKIIRIDILPGKTIKKDIPYVMIAHPKRSMKNVVIPVEAERVIKVEGMYAWFDITKEEFDKEAKRIKNIKVEREIYTGTLAGRDSSNRFWVGIDPSGLSHKRKERKR